MTALPVRRAHELDACPEEQRWLIEGLWAAEAVGILGGEPKCCKSFLALDMAVAVASGAPCLRRFPTIRRGRVLLFAAEDSPAVVRQRLAGIAAAVGSTLDALDIHVIVAPVLRLDVELDQRRLEETVAALSPMLLVLDPFVRLHRIDENVSAEVAPLLDYLRGLQRRHRVAVVLVHHARKGASHVRAGQALRGSSELHAWGDSNLYVRRSGDDGLSLTIEHRAARSADGIGLALHAEGDALALRVIDRAAPEPTPPPMPAIERVERILAEATSPMSQRDIRDLAKIRASTIGDALAALVTDGRVARTDGRYQLTRR
ncbi:MAG TPA: AAA family ATPase [Gaiellaceae bacterium]|nr:AAA family ATPase [Gaiellaceae bacterium]